METMKAELTALFIANTGYALANAALPRDLKPALSDIRQGIGYIPQFHSVFGKAIERTDGSIEWPANGLKGIVGNYFDNLEEEADTALIYMSDGVAGDDLKQAACAVYMERNRKAIAIPKSPSGEESVTLENQRTLRAYVAQRFGFCTTQLIKLLRDHGYNTVFPPRSQLSVNDLESAMNTELVPASEHVDNEGIDHHEQDADSWDIQTLIRTAKKGFELQPVEYELASLWQEAAQAWHEWVQILDAEDEVKEDVAYIVQRAKEFLAKQQSMSDLKGEKRVA